QFGFGVQMLATSVFMVLGPTTQQKWVTAAGRSVAVVAGIALSFVLINAIDSLEVLTIVWAIFPAIAIATLGVSLAFALGAYTTQMMMTIVLLGGEYEAFALDSNNRLVAEAIGIAIAVLAALFLEWWAKRRHVESFVNSEFDEAELAA
ncbi:MAG: FUSC family protein, partial [Acidimicrobiia bacterium]